MCVFGEEALFVEGRVCFFNSACVKYGRNSYLLVTLKSVEYHSGRWTENN